MARHGGAGLGEARYAARRGWAGRGQARRGTRQGAARQGKAGPGTARRGTGRLLDSRPICCILMSSEPGSNPWRKTMKRVVIVSDLHCGHAVGLTPPSWNHPKNDTPDQQAIFAYRKSLWGFFAATLKQLQPIDLLICNGDALEGKASRRGGTDLLTADRGEQAEMAQDALSYAKAKKYRFSYGTPYHTGTEEDWERQLADHFGAPIGANDTVVVEGVAINYKHHIPGSNVPHPRHTAVAREHLWNMLWAVRGA